LDLSVELPSFSHLADRRDIMPKVVVITSLAVALLAGSAAQAQTSGPAYPNRAVKLIVGFAAGGGTDVVARLVAQKLQEGLGQNVIVENRPGGNGTLAPDLVAKSTPDGYTLLFGASGQMAVSPAVYPKIPYQPLKDFVPVSMMSSYPLIMIVSGNHPAKNINEFVTWAKANPDKVNYGSTSPAFVLTSEMFKLRTGTPGQAIPFKSNNESVTSVIGDQVTYVIAEPPPLVPQVASGKARALAVAADKRLPELPDVPTMKEAGIDMKAALWLGLFAPAGTPAEIVKKLEAEGQRIAKLPDFQQRLRALSTDAIGSTSAEFAKAIDADIKMWSEVHKQSGVKFEQ
jgi:tripartite-type tricarboxylate transporter receptor subunit TctC